MTLPECPSTVPTITFVRERNLLRLVARPPLTATTTLLTLPATLDVGARGRLLGVEISVAAKPDLAAPWDGGDGPAIVICDRETATLYLTLEHPSGDHREARSAVASIRVLADGGGGLIAVEIPRRGHGYEIAYPSGNR